MLPHTKEAHRKYYAQFVRPIHKKWAQSLLEKYKDVELGEHLNEIPLNHFDAFATRQPSEVHKHLREMGDYLTLCTNCCIIKEAMRQIIEKQSAS